MLQMQRLQANSPLLCNSCDKKLGFISHNVNVAQFHYCDKCVEAQKFHPEHAFLQKWDMDIFHEPFADLSMEGSDGGILRAHKAVLAGKSSVFKTMLRAGIFESVSGKVKITDMKTEELRPLIQFLYTGRVSKKSLECHSVALYRASHQYDLPLLKDLCERFLQCNVSRDVQGAFELAVNHGAEKLQEAVLPFIFREGFVKSNPPTLVLKMVRAASQFACFPGYRETHFEEVSSLMELALYRMADFLVDPGQKKENKVVLSRDAKLVEMGETDKGTSMDVEGDDFIFQEALSVDYEPSMDVELGDCFIFKEAPTVEYIPLSIDGHPTHARKEMMGVYDVPKGPENNALSLGRTRSQVKKSKLEVGEEKQVGRPSKEVSRAKATKEEMVNVTQVFLVGDGGKRTLKLMK